MFNSSIEAPLPFYLHQLQPVLDIAQVVAKFAEDYEKGAFSAAAQVTAINMMTPAAYPLKGLYDRVNTLALERLQKRQGPVATMLREMARIEDLTDPTTWDEDGYKSHRKRLEEKLDALYPYYNPDASFDITSGTLVPVLEPYFCVANRNLFHVFRTPEVPEKLELNDGSFIQSERKDDRRNEGVWTYRFGLVFRQPKGSSCLCQFNLSRSGNAWDISTLINDVVENASYPASGSHFDVDQVKVKLKALVTAAGWSGDLRTSQSMTENQFKEAVRQEFAEHPLHSLYTKEGNASGRYRSEHRHTYDTHLLYNEDYLREDPSQYTWTMAIWDAPNERVLHAHGNAFDGLTRIDGDRYDRSAVLGITNEGYYYLFQELVKRRRLIEAKLQEDLASGHTYVDRDSDRDY